MAATWLRPLHVNKGKSIARTLGLRTEYAKNPDKTEGGELVAGYECDPRSADEEFMLAKREYDYNAALYHQADKPPVQREVSVEQAIFIL
jgi:hypothetical protein